MLKRLRRCRAPCKASSELASILHLGVWRKQKGMPKQSPQGPSKCEGSAAVSSPRGEACGNQESTEVWQEGLQRVVFFGCAGLGCCALSQAAVHGLLRWLLLLQRTGSRPRGFISSGMWA